MLHFQPDSRLALLSFKMFKFWIIPRSEAGSRLKVEHDRDSLNKMDFDNIPIDFIVTLNLFKDMKKRKRCN